MSRPTSITPYTLASRAVLAMEHNSDTTLDHEKWVPFLEEIIRSAMANADADKMTRMAWLDMPQTHPTNADIEITPGETLLLFGLIESWRKGKMWSLINTDQLQEQPF